MRSLTTSTNFISRSDELNGGKRPNADFYAHSLCFTFGKRKIAEISRVCRTVFVASCALVLSPSSLKSMDFNFFPDIAFWRCLRAFELFSPQHGFYISTGPLEIFEVSGSDRICVLRSTALSTILGARDSRLFSACSKRQSNLRRLCDFFHGPKYLLAKHFLDFFDPLRYSKGPLCQVHGRTHRVYIRHLYRLTEICAFITCAETPNTLRWYTEFSPFSSSHVMKSRIQSTVCVAAQYLRRTSWAFTTVISCAMTFTDVISVA